MVQRLAVIWIELQDPSPCMSARDVKAGHVGLASRGDSRFQISTSRLNRPFCLGRMNSMHVAFPSAPFRMRKSPPL